MTRPDETSPERHAGLHEAVARRIEADRRSDAFPAEALRGIAVAVTRRTGRTSAANVAGALRALDQAADVDVHPPVASSHRGGREVKRAIAKLTSWQVGYLADQVRDLGAATAKTVRALVARSEELELRIDELERRDAGARS